MQRDLVVRAQEGDVDAFAALTAGRIDRLYAAARLILRDDEQAADAVQDALLAEGVRDSGLRLRVVVNLGVPTGAINRKDSGTTRRSADPVPSYAPRLGLWIRAPS